MKMGKSKRSSQIHQRLKRKRYKPWQSKSSATAASASIATQSVVTKPGSLQTSSAEEATTPAFSTVGPQLNPKGGSPERMALKTPEDATIGNTAAQGAGGTIKLGPRVQVNVRPEVEAFIRGFYYAIDSLISAGLVAPRKNQDIALTALIKEVAKELYPDYEPPPPTKARSYVL